MISNYLTDLRAAGRSPATLESYDQTLHAFCRYLANHRVRGFRNVRADDIRGHLLSLREGGAKPSTVRQRAIILACFFNWLVRQGNLRVSPMQGVTRPKAASSGRKPLAKEEAMAMLAAGYRSRKPVRNVAILYLLLDCGLRASELLNVRSADYSQGAGTLVIRGKGGKQRIVRMGQRCTIAFELNLAERDGDLWGLTRKGLGKLVRRLGAQVGVRTYPHQLRHTFACYFLDAGGNLDELQCLLGHASIVTTMIYASAGQEARALRSHAEHSPGDRLEEAAPVRSGPLALPSPPEGRH